MIEAVDGNQIIAAFLGTGRPRGLGGRLAAVDPRTSDQARSTQEASAYAQPVDTVDFSQATFGAGRGEEPHKRGLPSSSQESTSSKESTGRISGQELSEEEQAQVRKLKERDAEVRRHEQAHKAAAGSLSSGGASFEYETGPDGKRYAVGGEVSIDSSSASGDPQATINKMRQIRRAALAPGNPSAQDRAVAAQAQAAERQAQLELREERAKSASGGGSSPEQGGAFPLPGGRSSLTPGGTFESVDGVSTAEGSSRRAQHTPPAAAASIASFAPQARTDQGQSTTGRLLDLVA